MTVLPPQGSSFHHPPASLPGYYDVPALDANNELVQLLALVERRTNMWARSLDLWNPFADALTWDDEGGQLHAHVDGHGTRTLVGHLRLYGGELRLQYVECRLNASGAQRWSFAVWRVDQLDNDSTEEEEDSPDADGDLLLLRVENGSFAGGVDPDEAWTIGVIQAWRRRVRRRAQAAIRGG